MVDQNKSDSSLLSINSSKSSLLKRRFSANRMLSKAKDTTKSLANEVLEKRHSLDSKRSVLSNEVNKDSTVTFDSQPHIPNVNQDNKTNHNPLKSLKKKLSTRRNKNNSINNSFISSTNTLNEQDSISSMTDATTSSSSSHSDIQQTTNNRNGTFTSAASVAEADILSGIERPGSFAIACDFQLANDKRNTEFHSLFKSVPESDMLIEYYKCALQKDILLQGHLYVSEHHVCFKSNIFGWVTNLVINFSEIVCVQKKMTAKIIPNGILIATNTSTHIFASFMSRDHAYEQIVKIWELSKRANQSTNSLVRDSMEDLEDLDEDDEEGSVSSNDSASMLLSPPILITDHQDPIIQQQVVENDVIQEPEKLAATVPTNNSTSSVNNNSSTNMYKTLKHRPRSVSDSFAGSNPITAYLSSVNTLNKGTSKPSENSGPVVLRKPRVCPCILQEEQHFHVALNETFHGSVDAMYRLLFNSTFYKNFLERYENFEDVQLGSWKQCHREVTGKRKIKSSTSGTRIIKVLFQETKMHRKMPYYCCVSTKKSMPDMPMGTVYSIQTRTCITRVNKEKVHVIISFEVVFSKGGLVSSIIEKNAADDQFRLYSHLNSILKKPDLLRELIQDQNLLQDLNLVEHNKKSLDNSNLTFKDALVKRIQSLKLTDMVYICFFIVLITHCVLALRLQRITHHLQWVQEHSQQNAYDSQWVNNKMNLAHQRVHQLKDEVKDYDKRINKLRNQSNNLKP